MIWKVWRKSRSSFSCHSSGGWLLSKFTSQGLLPKPAESWIYYPQFIWIHIPLSVGGSGRGGDLREEKMRSLTDGEMTGRERGRGQARVELPACQVAAQKLRLCLISDRETVTMVINLQLLHTGNHVISCPGSRGGMEQSEDRKWYF